MRTQPLWMLAFAALLLVVTACGGTESVEPAADPEPTPARFSVSVPDSRGQIITFDAPPERIVAFDSAAVEMLFAIGEGHRVIATHSFVSYPPDVETIPRVGDAFNANIEQIVALEPDLVFIFFDRFVPDLESAGLRVLYIESLNDDFRQTSEMIRMWGRITGSVDAAEAEAARFDAAVERLSEPVSIISQGPRVFQDTGGMWTPGPDTLVGEVFDLLKLQNIAYDISGYEQIAPEVVVARDPEVVITADPEGFLANPAFREVSAVVAGRVHSLPDDSLSIAGPRFVKGIEDLARLTYPILFDAPTRTGGSGDGN